MSCNPHISEHIPFQAKSKARAETAKIRRTRSSQPEKANFRALFTGTVVLVDSSHSAGVSKSSKNGFFIKLIFEV